MRFRRRLIAVAFAAAVSLPAISAVAQEAFPGDSVESLLDYARGNPDTRRCATRRTPRQQRVYPAGAFPDPMFRMELQNITNAGSRRVAEPAAQQGGQHQVHDLAAHSVLGQARPQARSGRGRRRTGAGPRGGDLVRARGERQDRLRPVLARRPQRAAHARDAGPARPPGEHRAGALRERAGAAAGRDPRPGRADRRCAANC